MRQDGTGYNLAVMRSPFVALALILASPAAADLRLVPMSCPVPDDGHCLAAFTLDDLAAAPARPVVVGETLVVLGTLPGATGFRDRLTVIKVDLSGPDPQMAGQTDLDATPTEHEGEVEIAADGRTYAIVTRDERDDQNRNRRVGAIQFFDQIGQRTGRQRRFSSRRPRRKTRPMCWAIWA